MSNIASEYESINMSFQIKLEDVLAAAERLKGVAYHTALTRYYQYSEAYGCNLFLKREDLQKVRSYKIRGAYNFMSTQPAETLKKGVVCASAGNHAQGVAFCCELLKVKGVIFMPATTPKQKIAQVRMFGKDQIEVVLGGDTFDDAFDSAQSYCSEHGLTFIHPFDDLQIIHGQATVGKEIVEDFDGKIDYLFLPVGGGGLASGVGSYVKKISPQTKIIGVEPEGAAGMQESIKAGKVVKLHEIEKFVDGAAVAQVGELNFQICKQVLDDIITIPEGHVCSWILRLYGEEAIVVEPAGALSIAALDYYKEEIRGKNVVCVLSGSNNEIDRMQEIKERSLIYEGLKYYLIVKFPQRAGALREFLDDVLGPDDDITYFDYSKKNNKEAGPAVVGLELKKKTDFAPLLERLNTKQIRYKILNDDPDLFEYFI